MTRKEVAVITIFLHGISIAVSNMHMSQKKFKKYQSRLTVRRARGQRFLNNVNYVCASESYHKIGDWARSQSRLPPPGSHEHFTRQTIVYRIDLFPTRPPSPSPLDPAVLVHIYLLMPLRSANHELASSSLRAFPQIQLASVSWTPKLPSSARNSRELLSRNFFIFCYSCHSNKCWNKINAIYMRNAQKIYLRNIKIYYNIIVFFHV